MFINQNFLANVLSIGQYTKMIERYFFIQIENQGDLFHSLRKTIFPYHPIELHQNNL